MKLLSYEVEHKILIGVLSKDEEWVFPVKSIGLDYKTMQELVEGMSESEGQLLEYMSGKDPFTIEGAARLDDVVKLAPIAVPKQDIICLGINYMAHAEESARAKKEEFHGERPYAVYFSKRVNEVSRDGQVIPNHSDITEKLDYEVELAVIIGKDARNVSPEEAKEYVFGYTIMNDISAREIQNRHKQWYFGKSLDGCTPMGPWIVTRDTFSYPPKLQLQCIVNGELRQDSNTELMIFDIDHIISELSQGMTLKAGTIISTGTPSGVGMGFDPPKFLKSGDTVECWIEGIGKIRNIIE
ncbi:MAG: fumarylacetoacetate hydrolase family protein [Lachnospiraceae bacterium]